MPNKAKVTSSISTKVKWEDDHDYDYREFLGQFYLSLETKPEGTAYIKVPARKMFVKGKEIAGLDIPSANIRYAYDIWVPGDYGHDNNPEYILQDYKRCLQFWHNEWCYQGCIVTVILTVKSVGENGHTRINKMEIGQDSLWDIESDCGDGYRKEIETDCLAAAKLEALEVLQTIRAMTESEIKEMFDE